MSGPVSPPDHTSPNIGHLTTHYSTSPYPCTRSSSPLLTATLCLLSHMSQPLPSQEVLHHVVDVHCHPTDAPSVSPHSMDRLQITICAMSTMQSDQQLVHDLAISYPTKVVPCFGQLRLLVQKPHLGAHSYCAKFRLT